VGRKGTGKTSLILREVKDYYGKLPNKSDGFEFYSKNYHRNGEEFSLQIWDTVIDNFIFRLGILNINL
jgi:GTPase SAR1 family protein